MGINTVGDMARMTEADLLKVRNFGKKSLEEVVKVLSDMHLSLGMNVEEVNSEEEEEIR
jgi:DNA-directed RNA polymerase subunit alpha